MNRPALLLLTLVALSACAPTAPVNPQSSPSPNPLDNAIEATASRGTAALSVEIVSDSDVLTGRGRTSLTSGRGMIEWTNQSDATTTTELTSRDGLYTQIDGDWFVAPVGTVSPTSGFLNPLGVLTEITPTSNPADGTLSGTAPLTLESGLNFSEEDLVNLPGDCPPVVQVSVDLDSAGLITRVSQEFVCPGNNRLSVVQLSDLGISLDLPEPTDAIEVPGNQ
ncbi:MAG: hypothetical protein K9G69_01345 [Candidatus Nanopelagicales bacterium]|nr:hypothetical protein [Candidatus Nanopelagicales bacterium]